MSASSVSRHTVVIGDGVHDDRNDSSPHPPTTFPPFLLLGLNAFTLFLKMSHIGGKLYLPPSLLRLGLRALIYYKVVKISVCSRFHHHAELSPMTMHDERFRKLEMGSSMWVLISPNQSLVKYRNHLDKLIKRHFRLTV